MKKAFTLVELMAAVLIGALIMLMVAGGLRGAIRSWGAVQTRVSQNYNRRSVLNLIKRQATSLYFERNAREISQQGSAGRRGMNQNPNSRRIGEADASSQIPVETDESEGSIVEFALPDGANYFMGNVQELNFISTVSYLSDFPGQVAVRYYVVQGQPDEDQTLGDMTSSRTENEVVDDGEEMEMAEAMVGDIYLYLEERNLFLAAAAEERDDGEEAILPGEESQLLDAAGSMSEVAATNTMKLIGPLREFSIRYRIPGVTRSSDVPDEERWADFWDLNADGRYPSAIEFTIYYEELGVTDDIETEDLERIRLVIPTYDSRNLTRGGIGNNAAFPN